MPRVLQPGYRLFASVIVAVIAFLLSARLPYTGSRIVFAWNTGVTVLLALIGTMMSRSDPGETLRRARKEETSNIVILLVTILAVAGALFAITSGLRNTGSMSGPLRTFQICESVAGVFLAWLLTHAMYSLHYAKLYYAEVADSCANGFRRGLVFPGNNDVVDYWDFVYFSFTIAMCFQTSDVTITSPSLRRLTIFHATISYFFALAILGLLLDGFFSNIG
jgi:uncharacterized membrane protein